MNAAAAGTSVASGQARRARRETENATAPAHTSQRERSSPLEQVRMQSMRCRRPGVPFAPVVVGDDALPDSSERAEIATSSAAVTTARRRRCREERLAARRRAASAIGHEGHGVRRGEELHGDGEGEHGPARSRPGAVRPVLDGDGDQREGEQSPARARARRRRPSGATVGYGGPITSSAPLRARARRRKAARRRRTRPAAGQRERARTRGGCPRPSRRTALRQPGATSRTRAAGRRTGPRRAAARAASRRGCRGRGPRRSSCACRARAVKQAACEGEAACGGPGQRPRSRALTAPGRDR